MADVQSRFRVAFDNSGERAHGKNLPRVIVPAESLPAYDEEAAQQAVAADNRRLSDWWRGSVRRVANAPAILRWFLREPRACSGGSIRWSWGWRSQLNAGPLGGRVTRTVIDKTFRRVIGLPCWNVAYDPQTNLSLNFGRPRLLVREPRPSRARSPKVRRLLSRRAIEAAIALLDGQRLEGVAVNPANGRTQFRFDLGACLDVRRFDARSEGELWTLYEPDGRALAVRGDGRFTHQEASQPDRYVPLE